MGKYKENPKTKGSGILCAIPQKGKCPIGCADCFFQSGRSFLEPLEDNLPNMPPKGKIVRVNDGNDSNNDKEKVIRMTDCYPDRFFNTSIPDLDFPGPVVLTINPGDMTDKDFHKIVPPSNLMFVRFRANTWNVDLLEKAIDFYKETPLVVTFMAYYQESVVLPDDYEYKQRTMNSYWCIKKEKWWEIMNKYRDFSFIYSCGKTPDTHSCARCGNCLREYHYIKELNNGSY